MTTPTAGRITRASKTGRKRILNGFRLIAVLTLLAATVFPLFWILVTSFKSNSEVLIQPPTIFPRDWTFEHIAAAFQPNGALPYLSNSVIATLGSTMLVLLFATPAAYALAHHRFARSAGGPIGMAIFAARFTPGFMLIIPLFILFRGLNLLDNIAALVIMYAVMNLPLAVWIILPAARDIPPELMEASAVDGAGTWRTFWSIGLPLLRPGMATAATLSMIFAWNEFFSALIFTQSRAQTAPLLMSKFLGDFGIQWGSLAATALIVAAPIVVLGIAAQRHLVRGLTAGAVK